MTRLPRITAAQAERALLRRGYAIVRQSGSHRLYRNAEGVRVTLPMHAGKILHPRLVRQLMDEVGLGPDEL